MLLNKFCGSKQQAPNYFHCAPKTGSTTLYYILSRHREFCAARGKEPNFYSDDAYYERGEQYFWSDRYAHYDGEKIAGDFSTSYISRNKYEQSLARIFKTHSPRKTFFSTCIRHPIMWSWSHYLHRVRNVDGFRKLAPINDTFREYLSKLSGNNGIETFEPQVRLLKETYRSPFAKKNLLVMIYERDVGPDLSTAYSKICNLLSIDPHNFVPIKGIVSSERKESDEVIYKWNGAGTFANLKANRAYFPAIYRAGYSGSNKKGETFSAGDIVIERDPENITVLREPDRVTCEKYLGYYDRVSTSLSEEVVEEITEKYFSKQLESLRNVLRDDVPEWDASRLEVSGIEEVSATYM